MKIDKLSIDRLQALVRRRFGKSVSKDSAGECTLSITADKVELSDEKCHIIARGPAKVATVLVRKRRAQ